MNKPRQVRLPDEHGLFCCTGHRCCCAHLCAPEPSRVAAQINAACRQSGFFYVVGHGVDAGLIARLESLSREFFALPTEMKQQIPMSEGGRGLARLLSRWR